MKRMIQRRGGIQRSDEQRDESLRGSKWRTKRRVVKRGEVENEEMSRSDEVCELKWLSNGVFFIFSRHLCHASLRWTQGTNS